MIRLTKEQIIENLKRDVCTRIMPSPIGGVGVFAIRDIPAGINPCGQKKLGESFA